MNRVAGEESMIPKFTITNEDCITGMAKLPESSIDLMVTSIPFEELYVYSHKVEDLGNNQTTLDLSAGAFALNLRYVITQLFRVMKPGCNACIHIQQLMALKSRHGFIGRRDFRGAVIDMFNDAGFDWTGEFAITKNPQYMAAAMNLHCLQFKTGYSRTATDLSPAPNDYVLIFQKPGETANPVLALKHPKNPNGWVSTEEWIRDAHGVWTDIQTGDVLDKNGTRESDQEKHICPLQLEVIRRIVRIYSNPIDVQPGVVVMDPFMGIGSTAWIALGASSPVTKLSAGGSRHVIGFELKPSYYNAAIKNAAKALRLTEAKQAPDMFSLKPEAMEVVS